MNVLVLSIKFLLILLPVLMVAFLYLHDFPFKEYGVGRNLVPV
jgi:hypothetical protein